MYAYTRRIEVGRHDVYTMHPLRRGQAVPRTGESEYLLHDLFGTQTGSIIYARTFVAFEDVTLSFLDEQLLPRRKVLCLQNAV